MGMEVHSSHKKSMSQTESDEFEYNQEEYNDEEEK
jgi:hypothetical protein